MSDRPPQIAEPISHAGIAGPSPEKSGVPAIIPPPPPAPRARRWRRLAFLAVLLPIVPGAVWWWTHRAPPLPPWIAYSNGRLDADEIDIDTKFAGRIAALMADEGDLVQAGQVLARMDTRDLEASLRSAEAAIDMARHSIDSAQADLVQQAAQLKLAAQQLQRSRALVPRGFATIEELDQRQSAYDAAVSAYHSTDAKLAAAKAALDQAEHNAELIRVNIADNTLVAPKPGPIEYREANVGEVLPAGGKVFTMLNAAYVYMDIFLPTAQAGRVLLGAPARIALDAVPDRPIPARVTFVASQNQFTPKTVETKQERDKLMFRIRVRIDPARSEQHIRQVRSGLPGLAYILLDPHGAWPEALAAQAAP